MADSKWKQYMPKCVADWMAVIFLLFTVHIIPIFEVYIILPYIDAEKRGTYWLHMAGGVYIYVNVMTCFVWTITTDTTSGSKILPSILKPGWRFCSACEANAPPRSLHCFFCNQCILKRDHHCMFTGNCVGYTNHRYFITLLFYFCMAALYCNFLNMDYTWEVIGEISFKSIFTMIVPLFAWMLGLTEAFTFGVAFISSICLIGFFLVGGLTAYHVMNACTGQSTWERARNNKEYDLGVVENLRCVFGEMWYIAWLSPFIPSPLPGNGIEFQKRWAFENVKDM